MARREKDKQLPQRRRLLAGAVLALLALAALATFFAWRQYDDAKRHALKEIDARVVLASTVFDIYFSEQVALFQSVASSPTVMSGDAKAMSAYFRRVQPPKGKLFTGGLGWIDVQGTRLASSSTSQSQPAVNVADRGYFRRVVATRKPYVSGGLVSRSDVHRRLVVTAVPTFDRAGRMTGVLAGALLRIHIEDYGQWRPPTPDPSRGRGIQIMETAMHATRIEHGRNGTKVALEQRLRVS